MNTAYRIKPVDISVRLSHVFAGHKDEEVVERLASVGYHTSFETVRRYRSGIAKRIAADFIAAVCIAYKCGAAWLLTNSEDGESPSPNFALPREQSATPVAMQEMRYQGALGICVACNNGSVWFLDGDVWHALPPVPNTTSEREEARAMIAELQAGPYPVDPNAAGA